MLKSKRIKRIVIGGLLSLFVLVMFVSAQEKSPAPEEIRREQLDKKSAELEQIKNNISLMDAKCKKLSSQYESAQRDTQQKKDDYLKAKDDYDISSKNAEMLPQKQLVQFLSNYKNADKKFKASESRLQKIKNKKEQIESNLNALNKERKEKEIEILGIKAKLCETELSKPIWVKGVGKCIMDENKTMQNCEKLAFEYAQKDAIEKGSKALRRRQTINFTI